MKASMKEILRRGAIILTMTAFCITGSYVFAHHRNELAEEAAAKQLLRSSALMLVMVHQLKLVMENGPAPRVGSWFLRICDIFDLIDSL